MTLSQAGGPAGGLPPDSTNQGVAAAGVSLSGEHAREYALKRLRKAQATQEQQSAKFQAPPPPTPIRRY